MNKIFIEKIFFFLIFYTMKQKKNKYHIILTKNGREIRKLFESNKLEDINTQLKHYKQESDKVIIPVQWTHQNKKFVETKYELYIIEHTDNPSKSQTQLRDEYGKFINYETTNKNWLIYDKIDYDKEETFWVYGYNPIYERKDFNWIYNNFIYKDKKNKHQFKQIVLYNNKLLILINNDLNIIITKRKSDCIRLYNTIYKFCEKEKVRYTAFCGDISRSKLKSQWIDRIIEKTGWNRLKIRRGKTRN